MTQSSARPFRTLDDIEGLHGKRVLVREDLNVPVADGKVSDGTRLRATVPTVAELSDKGAIVLVLAHFGRPKGQPDPAMSLAPIAAAYEDVLGRPVRFIGWDDAPAAVAAYVESRKREWLAGLARGLTLAGATPGAWARIQVGEAACLTLTAAGVVWALCLATLLPLHHLLTPQVSFGRTLVDELWWPAFAVIFGAMSIALGVVKLALAGFVRAGNRER